MIGSAAFRRLALILSMMTAWSPSRLPAAEVIRAEEEIAYPITFCSESRPVVIRLFLRVHDKPLEHAWHKYRDELFTRLDADTNGTFDEAERQSAKRIVSLVQGLGTRENSANKVLWECPADESGTCSRAMFFEALQEISESCLRRSSNPLTAASREALISPFAMLDENRDRSLSLSELTKSSQWLKYDWDDDGMVSLDELQVSTLRRSTVRTPAAKNPTVVEPRARLLLEDLTWAPQLIYSMIGQYDGVLPTAGNQPFGPKDGMLSAAELGFTPEQFKLHDRDKNERLDFVELQHYWRRPESMLDIDVDLTGAAVPAIRWSSPSLNARLEQQSIRLHIDNNIAVITAFRSGLNMDVSGMVAQRFRLIDRDQNGYLDEQDGIPNGQMSALRVADSNRDGKLYVEELQSAATEQSAWLTCHASLSGVHRSADLFQAMDLNRDQRISKPELEWLSRESEGWDRNGNQGIEPDEVPSRWTITLMQELGPIVSLFAAANPARGPQTNPLLNTGVPRWFSLMDRNFDRMVSKREFLGKLEDFAETDRNNDGFITPDEALRKETSVK